MKAIAAYMASRSNENRQGGNQNNYGEARSYSGGNQNGYSEMRGGNQGNYSEMRRGGNQSEYSGAENRQRQPNQYTSRNGVDEEWRKDNGMAGGGYSGGGMMNEETESRYRGRDGRWKSGQRRSEYSDEMEDAYSEQMTDNEPMQPNVVPWPRMPESRAIGFGENRSHYDDGRQEAEVGGKMWMQPISKERGGMMMFDRETAEEWVQNMRNEDKNHPHGGKWSPEALKPFAQKYNIQYDTPKFWQFYAMTNAMYSDYSEVARKFGITSPEFYACMAKAFMDDRDAEPEKVARYYEYIAKK